MKGLTSANFQIKIWKINNRKNKRKWRMWISDTCQVKFDDFGKVQSFKKKWNRKSKYFDANDEIIEHQKIRSKWKNEEKKNNQEMK